MTNLVPSYSFFDAEHWFKVKRERDRLGLARHAGRGELLPEHPLTGATLFGADTGKTYCVETVKRDWWQGWYLIAVLNDNGSHRACIIDALSCGSSDIVSQGLEFQKNFSIVSNAQKAVEMM